MAKNNGSNPPAGNQLARLVKGSASQVWQAGRGAYSLAGSEGSRLVGSLLNIGGRIDRGAKSRVFEARGSAVEAWERLESTFVQRVAQALNALQIPTARDVHELNRRVEALQKAVVALERRAAAAAAQPPRTAARKPAARKPVARKKPVAGAVKKAPQASKTKPRA